MIDEKTLYKNSMKTFSMACTKKDLNLVIGQMELVMKLEAIRDRQRELIEIMKK